MSITPSNTHLATEAEMDKLVSAGIEEDDLVDEDEFEQSIQNEEFVRQNNIPSDELVNIVTMIQNQGKAQVRVEKVPPESFEDILGDLKNGVQDAYLLKCLEKL
jgi:hypothetical protein